MPILIPKELERGLQLLNEGKIKEALVLIAEIEQNEDLTPVEMLKCQILKGRGLISTANYEKALKIGKIAEKEAKKLGKPLLAIEAIVMIKFGALFILGRRHEVWNDINSCEKLLKSAFQEPPSEIEQGRALLNFLKGYFNFWEGYLGRSIDYLLKCIPFFEQSTRLSVVLHSLYNIIGSAYTVKGELEQGLKYLKKSLIVSINTITSKMVEAGNYNWIGMIYHQQGKFDLAVDYFEKSLTIWKQYQHVESINFINMVYTNLIKVFLDQNSHEGAKDYLQRYKQFIEENKVPNNMYQLSEARILRLSPRSRDQAKAEKILKGLIKIHDAIKESGIRGIHMGIDPIIELCVLYLKELYSTNELGILNDIKPLISRLIQESERTKSFSVLAYTNLLQGKISELEMNWGDARRYLTQAQDVAEEHGLQLLARVVSKEHDKLLEQLVKIEKIEKFDMALTERLDFASFDEILAIMQAKRAIKAPELVNEEPIILLIITEGGIPIFSYPFADDWNREDELFASFMSAIESFSSEFFSEGLDRVKFGQYTVLMMPMAELSSCYLFKGQTYLAKQKLTRFTEGIQNNTSIMQTLNKYYQASQVVELKDFPFLEVFIKDVFEAN